MSRYDELTDERLGRVIADALAEAAVRTGPPAEASVVLPDDLHARTLEMRARRDSGELEGVGTGYARMDRMSGGWRDQELIVVAASAGVGKTMWALNCLYNMALRGEQVAFCSFEMGNAQVWDRILTLHGEDETATSLPFRFMGEETPTKEGLRAFVELMAASGARAVCIDHLSMLPALHTERRLSHAAWAQTFREWVKELKVPIVLIHHLRRQAKDNATPQLVDLAESQDIVNHADQVYLLQRETDHEELRHILAVQLKKSRNGGEIGFDAYAVRPNFRIEEAPSIVVHQTIDRLTKSDG